jgi:hypothetical protein
MGKLYKKGNIQLFTTRLPLFLLVTSIVTNAQIDVLANSYTATTDAPSVLISVGESIAGYNNVNLSGLADASWTIPSTKGVYASGEGSSLLHHIFNKAGDTLMPMNTIPCGSTTPL